ncbi:MAG: hypothetical protein R3255_06540 [Candidatus Lokiarchaeia archaeon]|nr:hypothetical protein [Candidatus Lokiarchaeia archaeon]
MAHDYFKYYNSKTLPFLLVGMFGLLWLAKDYWTLSFSIFSALSLLLALISTYLWKFKPFKYLFWVDNFSGRYEGFLQYQYKDENGLLQSGRLKHVKLVNQNGHRITVSSFTIKDDGTKSSLSVNKGMHVEKTEDEQHYRLIYNYLNEGSTEQGFPPHYGTEVIKFIRNGKNKHLSGGYYTGREPYQTKGEFSELKWVSNDLNHEF